MARLKQKQLDGLLKSAAAATQGPWAYSTGCGAQVIVGLVHHEEQGHVSLEKGGFFFFEIDPDVYEGNGGEERLLEEYEEQALADVKFIALSHPGVVTAIVEELIALRKQIRDKA